MIDFDVKRCTRRCAATERELQPEEVFYSALVPQGAALVRVDYSEQGWQGPPQQAVGWWRSKMPAKQSAGYRLAPNQVLLQVFRDLGDRPEKAELRYLLCLLLVRRRLLQLLPNKPPEAGPIDAGREAGEAETMFVSEGKNEEPIPVATFALDAAQAAALQDELIALLYAEDERPPEVMDQDQHGDTDPGEDTSESSD
jgi:hypothetical protein